MWHHMFVEQIPVGEKLLRTVIVYAIVAVLAHALWNEPLGWPQLGGIVLIGSGVLLMHQH